MQAGPSQTVPSRMPFDTLSQLELSATFRGMKASVTEFLEMLAGYSEEWPNGCLVMPASKLGRLHSQIKMALEYLNNGYIEFVKIYPPTQLSNTYPPIPYVAIERHSFLMESNVPAIAQPYQDFPVTTKITNEMCKKFIQLMRGRVRIRNCREMLEELERDMGILNKMAEAIDLTVQMASFIAECHLAELTVPAQVTQKGNFYDNKRHECGQETFRDRAVVVAALEMQKAKRASVEHPTPTGILTPPETAYEVPARKQRRPLIYQSKAYQKAKNRKLAIRA